MIYRAAALLTVLVTGTSGSTVGHPLPLPRYMSSVHAVRLSVDQLAKRPRFRAAQLAPVQRRLRALDRVALPDGRVVATDTPRLADDLAPRTRSSLLSVAGRLDALDEALQGQPRTRPDRAVLASLDDVLRDTRFHPGRSLLQQIEDWLLQTALRFLHAIGIPRSAAGLSGVVAGVFLLLVIMIGALAARGVLRRVVLEATVAEGAIERLTYVSERAEADRLAANGEHRAALGHLVRATLLALQEVGLLELHPGMTNRELLQSLRAQTHGEPRIRESLGLLVDSFDRVWYGHAPIGDDEYGECVRLADRVREGVRSEDRAA